MPFKINLNSLNRKKPSKVKTTTKNLFLPFPVQAALECVRYFIQHLRKALNSYNILELPLYWE